MLGQIRNSQIELRQKLRQKLSQNGQQFGEQACSGQQWSATAYDDGLKVWLAVPKNGINTGSDASAKALARAFATEVTKRLLDV
jgi:hypothetical protein